MRPFNTYHRIQIEMRRIRESRIVGDEETKEELVTM